MISGVDGPARRMMGVSTTLPLLPRCATAKVKGYVVATSAAAVVTVKALAPGLAGNCFTWVSSDGTRAAVTGSGFLTGGAGADVAATTYTRS